MAVPTQIALATANQADQPDELAKHSGAPATQGAYNLRESYLHQQETAGEITFKYILNDGSPDNNAWLIGLKNIYSKQLPNMPKEYITRLVMDRRHRSIGIVKGNSNSTILGGITYRVFPSQKFGEIAFCAITAAEQVKGYGTRLMNYTKEFAKIQDSLGHFLTFADNNAVGYFSKQGFTKELTMPRTQWTGHIKDYDGGTLMECILHPRICYTTFPDMMQIQRSALDGRVRGQSNSHVVHEGLKLVNAGGHRTPIAIQHIPGVSGAGWAEDMLTPSDYMLVLGGQVHQPTKEKLQQFMLSALREMQQHEDSWPFVDPVDGADVPDYYEVVKDPVDLSLIEKRLKGQNYYLTLDIFTSDFKRMFTNCRLYNAADTIYYKLANKLEASFEFLLSKSVVM